MVYLRHGLVIKLLLWLIEVALSWYLYTDKFVGLFFFLFMAQIVSCTIKSSNIWRTGELLKGTIEPCLLIVGAMPRQLQLHHVIKKLHNHCSCMESQTLIYYKGDIVHDFVS